MAKTATARRPKKSPSLDTKVARYLELKADIKVLEAEADALNKELKAHLLTLGDDLDTGEVILQLKPTYRTVYNVTPQELHAVGGRKAFDLLAIHAPSATAFQNKDHTTARTLAMDRLLRDRQETTLHYYSLLTLPRTS